MGRPRTNRTDNGNVIRLEKLHEAQQMRFEAMKRFRGVLMDLDVQQEVKGDDQLFSTLLSLAFDSYGVRQSDLTEKLGLSAGVLGRWARMTNLPVSALRPVVISAIGEAMDPAIERQESELIPQGMVN